MKKDKVVLDFIKIPIAQKVEFTRGVISKMKNNPKFTDLVVKVEELEAKVDLLETRSVAALGGGKEATALMHQTEYELDDMLRKMAKSVDGIADGDNTIILSSGFNLAKQPAPAIRPDFSVELGDRSGSVIIRRQAVDGAKSYIWQYCSGETPAATDAEWTTAKVTSKASVEISGLTALTKYWFRSAVVTASYTSPYTSPIMQGVV